MPLSLSPSACFAPLTANPDPVFGQTYLPARSQRDPDGACGPDGKLYEPSLWRRICASLSGAIATLLIVMVAAHAAEYRPTYLSNYDADTLRLSIEGRNEAVRLADVDAPEIRGKCQAERDLAIRGREFTRTWAQRSELILTTGKREREKYGRLLGTLTNTEGESLGDKLIEAGLAVRWEGRRHQGWCE